jgi:hypothetical protein
LDKGIEGSPTVVCNDVCADGKHSNDEDSLQGTCAVTLEEVVPGSVTEASATVVCDDVCADGNAPRTLHSNDEELSQAICAATLEKVAGFEGAPKLESHSSRAWMVWMVHRVSLNDPSLVTLDFRNCALPSSVEEPRIIAKLFRALETNTYLKTLTLTCSNLKGENEVRDLASSLNVNTTLEVLNLENNMLSASDLQILFESIGRNTGLKELRCSDQFEQDLNDCRLFVAVNEALKLNQTLQKLGLDLSDWHYRDQITRSLIRNTEAARRNGRNNR